MRLPLRIVKCVYRLLRESSRHTVIFSLCASEVPHISVGIAPFQKQFWQDGNIKFLRVDQEILGIIRVAHLWVKQHPKFFTQYVISYVVIFGVHSAELVDIESIDRARQIVSDGMAEVSDRMWIIVKFQINVCAIFVCSARGILAALSNALGIIDNSCLIFF
jgi:hypothetical protein